MKRICLLLCGILCALPPAARADYDEQEYPFVHACTSEIDNYCGDQVAGDLGDCMINNYDLLGSECQNYIFFWAGEHYGWRDQFLHDQWYDMSQSERHAYIQDHGDELTTFKARAAENLPPFGHHPSAAGPHAADDSHDYTPGGDHGIHSQNDYTPDPRE